MAITKTSELTQITVHVAGIMAMDGSDTGPWILCSYVDTIDDPDDDSLPITHARAKQYRRDDDVSGEDQLVQDIAAVVWA